MALSVHKLLFILNFFLCILTLYFKKSVLVIVFFNNDQPTFEPICVFLRKLYIFTDIDFETFCTNIPLHYCTKTTSCFLKNIRTSLKPFRFYSCTSSSESFSSIKASPSAGSCVSSPKRASNSLRSIRSFSISNAAHE